MLRHAAVAGSFYPAEPEILRAQVDAFLAGEAGPAPGHAPRPKALIVPHAGYIYSGPTAACAYRCLAGRAAGITRVVLLGPAHRVWLAGLALPEAEAFATPLGTVPLDAEACERARALPGVFVSGEAHAQEHCLEVQLPFLQRVLGAFTLVPLVVGEASPGTVATVLEALWGGPETLIIISTDLSHYLDYDTARTRDAATCAAILAGRTGLSGEQACGCRPLNGFLQHAARRGGELTQLDYRNSGDTAGSRDRVVGYGAFAWYEP